MYCNHSWPKRKQRTTLEHCYRIDADRAVLLASTGSRKAHPGSSRPILCRDFVKLEARLWEYGIDIELWELFSYLRNDLVRKVGYPADDQAKPLVTSRVGIVSTLTPLGGTRFWFECPYCSRKCQSLYWNSYDSIKCRLCLRLQYASSQLQRRIQAFAYDRSSEENQPTWALGHDWERNQERRNRYRRDKRRAHKDSQRLSMV